MTCTQSKTLVAAHADGELDVLRGYAFSRHLRTCAECAAEHRGILALRARVRAQAPRYTVPDQLRARVLASVEGARDTRRPSPERGERWRWATAGAAAGVLATLLVFAGGTTIVDRRAREGLAVEAVAAHVRAQLDDRLIAIASSDQHTVKPWLSARLDYSPPVQDLPDAGFPLAGGRLDHLAGQPVAVLVYHYRLHTVDVFVRPAIGDVALSQRTLRGFNVVTETGSGMQWVAVSDASADVLGGLVERLAAGARAP